mgnify:CR=1 FL=1|jgi:hypothetical protein
MHARLISYLKDNRDQIIENWLLEVDVPPANGSEATDSGVVPLTFLTQAFDTTLQVIESGQAPNGSNEGMHLDDILGVTTACKQRCMGGRVCIELHDSGLTAFLSVFDTNWDAAGEFNEFDRENYADLINHALSGLFASEIEHCKYKHFRSDCPFISGTPGQATADV